MPKNVRVKEHYRKKPTGRIRKCGRCGGTGKGELGWGNCSVCGGKGWVRV